MSNIESEIVWRKKNIATTYPESEIGVVIVNTSYFIERLSALAIAEAKVARVRERHHEEKRWQPYPEYEGSFDTAQEAWDVRCDEGIDDGIGLADEAQLHFFLVCAECSAINKSAMDDLDDWVYLPEVYFPCPTYQDTEGEG